VDPIAAARAIATSCGLHVCGANGDEGPRNVECTREGVRALVNPLKAER
jgi:hypothetical protein